MQASTVLGQATGGSTKVSSPAEVGWLFVPQYYTFVNKDPSRLHCFYTKRSTFIHGLEGEEVTPRHGQQEIHEKILSLGFEDCKVYVSNVDSQSSAEGGIIVQVLGEMCNKGSEWRKFAQTFFLAEQPNGYFVLNDIFRYIKEENDERDDMPGPPSPAQVHQNLPTIVHPPEDTYTPATRQQPMESIAQQPHVPPGVNYGMPQELESLRRSPQVVQHQVNGWHHHADSSATASSTVESTIESPPPAVTAPEPPQSVVDTPAEPPAAEAPLPEPVPGPMAQEQIVSASQTSATPVEPVSTPQTASEASSPAPTPVKKTWANLAASASGAGGAWGRGAPVIPKAVSANASAPTTAAPSSVARAPAPTASTSAMPAQPAATASGRPIPNVGGLSHPHCFVKNVQEQVTDEGLRRVLEDNFGPIKELDIVRSKACAFLEFKSIESAKKAIHFCSPHSVGGNGGIECDGMFIHIEEKKPKGDSTRLSGQPRGGGRAGAGASGQGGGRGGAASSGQSGAGRSSGGGPRPAGGNAANTVAANRGKQK